MANSKIPNVNLSDTMNAHRLRFNQLLDSVGDVSTLTTVAGPVVGAINEHDAELGEITSIAMGTNASTVSGAIAELDDRLDSINQTQLSTPKIFVADSNATSHIKGSVDIDTNLNVGGNVIINGTTAIAAGADGNINLGDGLQDSDTVIFNAEIGSHIVPGTDNLHDIGSGSKEFRHGYFDGTVNADELAADSATIGTLKVTDLTNNRVTIAGASGELEDDTNFTFDGTALSVGNTSIDIGATGINTTGLEADSATITANADITGNLDVGGNFTADGNVDLGNASSDTVSINGQVDTDIVPSTDNARSLGSASKEWKHGYFDGTVNADELAADSATIGTLKVTDLSAGRIVIVGSGGEIADDADLTYNTSTDTLAVSKIDIGTSAALASATVEDLTNNRIVIAGTGGELEDDANFTFDGDIFTVGSTSIDKGATGINTTGMEADSATISNNIAVGGNLDVTGTFTVGGLVTFTGDTRTAASYQILNDGVTVANGNRAGLAIDRPSNDSAVIQWNELGDYWEAGVTQDLGRLALQGDSAQFLRVDGTTGSFDTVDVSGNLGAGGNLSAGGNLNVDGLTTLDSTTVDGDMQVTGNFTVGGTTTYINTETVTIDDNIIVLNNNATGTPATNQDAGIEVERGSAANIQLLWDESGKYWVAATDTNNTLSRIATANWIDATSPITYNSTSGNISHANSGVSAGTYGSVTVDAKGHVTSGSNPTYDNYVKWVAQDSDGTTYDITAGDTLTFRGDDDVITTNFVADDVLKISHKTSAASSSNNSGNTFIQDLTLDGYGHITGLATGSVSISDDTITISPRDGLKTGGNFTLNGSATTIYIDIDSAELRDDYIEKLYFDQLLLNGPGSGYKGNIQSSTANFRLSSDTSDTTNRPVSLHLMNTDTTLSDGAVLGYVNFQGENSNGGRVTYSRIEGSAVDVTDTTEDGQLELKSGMAGTLYTGLDLNSGVAYLKSNETLYLQSEYNSSAQARFRFENPTTAANTSKPSYVEIYNNNPDPTDDMIIGEIQFQAENSNSVDNMYAGIRAKVKDYTATTRDGELEIRVLNNSSFDPVFFADSNTSVLAFKDIYLQPTGDDVYMQGTTSGEQLRFNLLTATQTITASDTLNLASGSNLELNTATGLVYIQEAGTGKITIDTTRDTTSSLISTAEEHLCFTSADNDIRMEGTLSTTWIRFDVNSATTQSMISSGSMLIQTDNTGTEEISIESPDIKLNVTGTDASGRINFLDGGTERASLEPTNNNLKLYIGSNNGSLNTTWSGDDMTVQGDITSISDVRTKENIEPITDGLEIVDSLRGVRYNKIGKEDRKVGVIAQEVEGVLPEVINTDDEGMKSVDYGKMVGVLIEAIKDLKSEVDMLKLKLGE